MTLAAGFHLGVYEITGSLGVGGMGEVYRARDTKLNREVALKTLPAAFTDDPERVARFRREAQVLAALNHPHIAHIYGLDEIDGYHFLVMELVDGQSLDKRIARGPISLDEALPIARQIAAALEAAHEKGIIHRDLKPANIALTSDGVVKVLDFGLAKAMEPTGASSSDPANSPTITSPAMMTGVGIILGTAAYMSPEQAKGRAADKRSDVWAFGCVLYEMLSGARPFSGDDVADTLAAVLTREPDLTRLPPNTPARIVTTLKRCLERDRMQRLRDIGDAALTLNGAFDNEPGEGTHRGAYTKKGIATASVVAVFALAILVLGFGQTFSRTVERRRIVSFTVALPEGQTFSTTGRSNLAISRDGSQVVYAADGRLFRRILSEFSARPISGTETQAGRGFLDAISSPAFSPNGREVAFFSPTDRTLKRIPVEGGVPSTVCAPERPPFGLTWSDSDIVFGQGTNGIVRCPATGGTIEQLAKVEPSEEAYGPQILPGTGTLLFTIASARDGLNRWDKARIVVQSPPSGTLKTVIEGGSDARYVSSGHLLYAVAGTVMAVPFDARKGITSGTAVPVVPGVQRPLNASTGLAQFATSDEGTLIYIPGPPRGRTRERAIATAAPGGTIERVNVSVGPYVMTRSSRDGKSIAIESDDVNEAMIVLLRRMGDNALQRLTFGGNNRLPVWSPTGDRIAFQSDREGDLGIFIQRVDGSGMPTRLTRPEEGKTHAPEAWSPDGRTLLYAVKDQSVWTLWMVSLDSGSTKQFPDITSTDVIGAVFSPDGKWVAYRSNVGVPDAPNTGVYVQPFPPTGAKYQAPKIVSDFQPVWSPTGESLVYIPSGASGKMAIVRVTKAGGLSFGTPTIIPALVTGQGISVAPRAWDILPDGRFVGLIAPDQDGPISISSQFRVVLNWFTELQQRVPTR